jgi:GcrA cell cycle regulator
MSAPSGGTARPETPWTDEKVAKLRELWAEGIPTLELGRRLGLTKHAVIGKVHRLNLPPRPTPVRPVAPAKRKPSKPWSERAMITERNKDRLRAAEGYAPLPQKTPTPKAPKPAYRPPVVFGTVKQCCWPMWNNQERSGGEKARFCCAATEPGWQYCDEHLGIAYLTWKTRREVANAA